MNNLLKKLKRLGLKEKHAKIYLATLELGETTIKRIAQKSGIKRTTIYGLLDDLTKEGLLSITKRKGQNYYFAHDPIKIQINLQEKIEVAKKIMPELLSITNLLDKKPKISFFEGKEEIKNIYKETLKYPGREVIMWVSKAPFPYYDDPFWYEYYMPQRFKKKIWIRMIMSDSKEAKKIKSNDKKELRKTKISQEKFIESEIFLYGDKNIAVISFEEMMGLNIESKRLFNTLKGLFEIHWKSLEN